MSSMTYWNVASAVKAELEGLAAVGDEMYSALETSDDPSEIADFLSSIEPRLNKLSAAIKENIPALRKVAKALDDVPGIR